MKIIFKTHLQQKQINCYKMLVNFNLSINKILNKVLVRNNHHQIKSQILKKKKKNRKKNGKRNDFNQKKFYLIQKIVSRGRKIPIKIN